MVDVKVSSQRDLITFSEDQQRIERVLSLASKNLSCLGHQAAQPQHILVDKGSLGEARYFRHDVLAVALAESKDVDASSSKEQVITGTPCERVIEFAGEQRVASSTAQ